MNKSTVETEVYPSLKLNSDLVMPGVSVDSNECFISGQWMFAKGHDIQTNEILFHELPWSIGLITPIVFSQNKGRVLHTCKSPEWYKTALETNFKYRQASELTMKIHKKQKTKRAWLVNCLLPHYGDCLSLLFRTGPLRDTSRGAIALVPSSMVRFVPSWFAEIWEIQNIDSASLQRFCQWNESMNQKIQNEFKRFESVAIPHLFQPAAPHFKEVCDYISVKPFDASEWNKEPYTITFLWREQRLSPPELSIDSRFIVVLAKLRIIRPLNNILRLISLIRYRRFILQTCLAIKKKIPSSSFNVVGLGKFPDLPEWINDFRVRSHSIISDRDDELIASKSHVLISAHGSHLVGLSSLPGCTIQLIPDSKWENWLDALSIRDRDEGGWIDYLSIPTNISPNTLACIVSSRIRKGSIFRVAYSKNYSGLITTDRVQTIRDLQ